MAKFSYKMQNILDIKIKLEEQEKIAFAQANAALVEEQKLLQQIMLQRAGYEKQLKELATGTIDIRAIRICKNSIESMKVAIRDQMIAVSKAQRVVENERKKLNDMMMERKMHEKLREKAFLSFVEELNKEESKITDELVSYTYGLSHEEE